MRVVWVWEIESVFCSLNCQLLFGSHGAKGFRIENPFVYCTVWHEIHCMMYGREDGWLVAWCMHFLPIGMTVNSLYNNINAHTNLSLSPTLSIDIAHTLDRQFSVMLEPELAAHARTRLITWRHDVISSWTRIIIMQNHLRSSYVCVHILVNAIGHFRIIHVSLVPSRLHTFLMRCIRQQQQQQQGQ